MGRFVNKDAPVSAKPVSSTSMRLVLASASPRRRELLEALGIPFTTIPTSAEERDDPVPSEIVAALPDCPLPLLQHPTVLAWRKAYAVWQQGIADVVLAADTDVVLEKTVLGKPRDADHARTMLRQLAGRTHTVYTGLCVYSRLPGGPPLQLDLVVSEVTMIPLTDDLIEGYIATGEPFDKAGAYGIQGIGGQLVDNVLGSYTSVVGLPLRATWRLLAAAGISGLEDPITAYHAWLQSQGKEPMPCSPAQA